MLLNPMLDLLQASHKQEEIQLTHNFHQDLQWFLTFLPQVQWHSLLWSYKISRWIQLDASMNGLGAQFNNAFFAIHLPRGYLQMDIVHLEMLNILVTVRVWKHVWVTNILIHCDNRTVVSVLNSSKTRENILRALGRNIFMEAGEADI